MWKLVLHRLDHVPQEADIFHRSLPTCHKAGEPLESSTVPHNFDTTAPTETVQTCPSQLSHFVLPFTEPISAAVHWDRFTQPVSDVPRGRELVF